MTFLCVGSIPVRNSGFPKRSSCAGSSPDVCFSLRGDEDGEELLNQSPPPGGGSSVNCCGYGKMDNLSRIFIIHIPKGKALVAR